MNATLSPFDRATLIAWRGINVVGWSALGAFLSWNLHWMAVQVWSTMQLAGYHRAEPGWDLGAGSTAKVIAYRLGLALVISWVIWAVVARRVWIRPALFATISAVAYAILIIVTLEHSQTTGGRVVFGLGAGDRPLVGNSLTRMLLHDLAIASAIPLTWFAARKESRRRPSV